MKQNGVVRHRRKHIKHPLINDAEYIKNNVLAIFALVVSNSPDFFYVCKNLQKDTTYL
jgi:hypothetical protein